MLSVREIIFTRSSTSCGRAFYTVPERKLELSAGLQLHHGFIQSAIMAHNPYLNVDGNIAFFYCTSAA